MELEAQHRCGLHLFAAKRILAQKYLSEKGCTYRTSSSACEAVAQWNGGTHHIWDAPESSKMPAATLARS
jgi:hypothetical protein